MYLYAVYYFEDWQFLGLFCASNSQALLNRLPDWMNPLELTWHIYTTWGD
jgi:hypothetical protein